MSVVADCAQIVVYFISKLQALGLGEKGCRGEEGAWLGTASYVPILSTPDHCARRLFPLLPK